MRKNVILSALRIDSELYAKLKKSLEEINSNSLIELKLKDVRRLSYSLLCDFVLNRKDFSFLLKIKK